MNRVRKFTRVIEDFDCLNCGHHVVGDGFTNHCPKCFSSRHVDIFPGDRLEECQGLMKVIEITKSGDKTILTHKCEKCGEESRDHFREKIDDFDSLLLITEEINRTKTT